MIKNSKNGKIITIKFPINCSEVVKMDINSHTGEFVVPNKSELFNSIGKHYIINKYKPSLS